MDAQRLAEMRAYAASGKPGHMNYDMARQLLAHIAELEEWKADVERANRSDAKLALYLYERVRRLLAVVASASILRDARTQAAHDLAARNFDCKLAAMEPGDLAE